MDASAHLANKLDFVESRPLFSLGLSTLTETRHSRIATESIDPVGLIVVGYRTLPDVAPDKTLTRTRQDSSNLIGFRFLLTTEICNCYSGAMEQDS